MIFREIFYNVDLIMRMRMRNFRDLATTLSFGDSLSTERTGSIKGTA